MEGTFTEGVLRWHDFYALVGWSQHQAQGTTLAMLVPPIGILAAYTYYKQGYVDLKVAALICAGFFFGGLLGARMATAMSELMLRKVLGWRCCSSLCG